MAFRASGAALRMFSARFVTLLSADAVHLELSHISSVELFSDRKEQMLGLACQYVEMMTIGMINSKLLRKSSIKKSLLDFAHRSFTQNQRL